MAKTSQTLHRCVDVRITIHDVVIDGVAKSKLVSFQTIVVFLCMSMDGIDLVDDLDISTAIVEIHIDVDVHVDIIGRFPGCIFEFVFVCMYV